jgi:hypothetical protein
MCGCAMSVSDVDHLQEGLRDLVGGALGAGQRRRSEAGLQVLRRRRQQARPLLPLLLLQKLVSQAGGARRAAPGALELPPHAT